MLVVNLFGAPGAGKSSLALLVSGLLKTSYPEFSVECPDEFAKTIVYDEAHKALSCQLYIAGRQQWQIARCEGHADIVVCDSPVLMSWVYGSENGNKVPPEFFDVCRFYHSKYDTLNFLLFRDHEFDRRGRIHTHDDELRINTKILDTLKAARVPVIIVKSDVTWAAKIADYVAIRAKQMKKYE